ncbi:hypothetical protein VXM60_13665 [Shewanella khirikhana]|uniref:hypothetical protein n=1 Tax=Shewanella khirikhana TaxID=1965282 RepID=UPI0030CAA4EC
MPIQSLQEAIASQAEINRFLAKNGIKDLVGDYGELLIHKALGGNRENAVNQGFDIQHPHYKRIEVKTRKYELLQSGGVRKEGRAVGFKGKEDGFDWLAHIVLDVDFSVVGGCLVSYQDVWPEVQRTKDKIGFSTSSKLPSSINITNQLRDAQKALGYGI